MTFGEDAAHAVFCEVLVFRRVEWLLGRDMCGFKGDSGYIHFVTPQCMMRISISPIDLSLGGLRLGLQGVVSREVSR